MVTLENNTTDNRRTLFCLLLILFACIIGTNSRGLWNKTGQTLGITSLPLWYQAWWAYLLFFTLISGLFYWAYQFQLSRQLAFQEAKRLEALDKAKIRLYTNIIHEFRAPLTVILGMSQNTRESLGSSSNQVLENNLKLVEIQLTNATFWIKDFLIGKEDHFFLFANG